MTNDARLYELLAADYSPVALLVLGARDGLVRHVNHTMALLLGPAGQFLPGHSLSAFAPELWDVLLPLIRAVGERGRPRRTPGLQLPFAERNERERTWDAVCAPLPPDRSAAPPETVGIWLWPEDTGVAASRRIVETLRDGMAGAIPCDVPGYEIAAALVPADAGAALGGDTYDVLAVGPNRWAILMADVAGRGAAAAARAVLVRHSARVLLMQKGPGPALSSLSGLLVADPTFTGFVTAFAGVLDVEAQTLTYVVAGHDPALLLRGEDGALSELAGNGELPLGVDEEADYTEHRVAFTPRDLLLLYTDGLTDTRRDLEFFDIARVHEAVRRHCKLPPPAFIATLLAEAAEWAGPSALRDDTALLAVRGNDAD